MLNKMEAGQNQEDSKGQEEIDQFFEAHGQFLEKYAGDSSIQIKPSPEGLGTFAIDMENGVLYAEPKFFTDKKYSADKALFATLHEFEHFREMKELLAEEGGDKVWTKHCEKIKKNQRLHILDNCFDDIKMNRQVVGRAPILELSREKLYRDNLFSTTDYSDQPKHLQFAYALTRRAMLPNDEMTLSPEVQAEIDKLDAIENNGVKLLEYASRPETAMSTRLKLQESFLVPAYERFFQEDVKDKEQQGDDGKGEGQGGEGEAGAGEESNQSAGDENEDKKDKNKPDKDKIIPKSDTDKKNDKEGTGGISEESGKQKRPTNPEDYFKDNYDEYNKNNPEPIDYSSDEMQKKVEEYIKSQAGQSAEQQALEAYAKAEGVSFQEVKEYQRYYKQLENIENPETGEKVIDELRKIFEQIISERKKEKYALKHPLSEGEILINPAEAVSAVMSGENEPEVWQSQEKKDLPQELFGDFDVTLVADRSGSMDGKKAIEQRKAMMLALEALKEFCDDLIDMRSDMKHELNVRSEVWGFGGEAEVKMLKPLSENLTEKQRVSVYKDLATTPGSQTLDYLALEKIKDEVTEEDWQKIKDNKLRKVIIVFTDGESHGAERVQKILREFDEAGVAVAAIGVTTSGKSAETTYAPNGQVCESAEKLAVVLADLLKKYLKDLLVKR